MYVACYRMLGDGWPPDMPVGDLESVFFVTAAEKKREVVDNWYHNIIVGAKHTSAVQPSYKEPVKNFHLTWTLKVITRPEAETYKEFGLISEFEDGNNHTFIPIHLSF